MCPLTTRCTPAWSLPCTAYHDNGSQQESCFQHYLSAQIVLRHSLSKLTVCLPACAQGWRQMAADALAQRTGRASRASRCSVQPRPTRGSVWGRVLRTAFVRPREARSRCFLCSRKSPTTPLWRSQRAKGTDDDCENSGFTLKSRSYMPSFVWNSDDAVSMPIWTCRTRRTKHMISQGTWSWVRTLSYKQASTCPHCTLDDTTRGQICYTLEETTYA